MTSAIEKRAATVGSFGVRVRSASSSPSLSEIWIYRFRLRFVAGTRLNTRLNGSVPTHGADELHEASANHARTTHERRFRAFDTAKRPSPAAPASVQESPEETAARREKATQGHHDAVSELAQILTALGWSEPQEVWLAIDLCAAPREARLRRVLFEVKTLPAGKELQRTRAALAQLLEYRLLYGEPDDELCLVTTAPVSDHRIRLLRTLGVDVVWIDHGKIVTHGACTSQSVAGLVAGN